MEHVGHEEKLSVLTFTFANPSSRACATTSFSGHAMIPRVHTEEIFNFSFRLWSPKPDLLTTPIFNNIRASLLQRLQKCLRMIMTSDKDRIVVGVDFGTTFSG